MDGQGKRAYDPASSLRGEVSTQAEKLDGGIGLGAEKNPTPTLRMFGTNLGNQWLCYGTIGGGTQDYTPSPPGSNTPAGCRWFQFYYTGLMVMAGEAVFGNWRVKVEGDGLEPVAHQVGKHTKTTLMVGEKVSGLNPITVRSITIEGYKPKKMKIVGGKVEAVNDEDDDDPYSAPC
jgi:hypothetical protein